MSVDASLDRPHAVIQLHLLGGFLAERDGRPLPGQAWGRQSGRTLVKLLAIEPSHRLHREQVQDLLWPDHEPAAAANAFRKALHFARHALDPDLAPRAESALIRMRDDTVELSPGLVWIDIDDFRERARAALAASDPAAIASALAGYPGELLPEDRYESWAAPARLALADQHVALLLALAALDERRGRLAQAVEHLQRVLALDPAREDVHREVMRLSARAGQRHQALRQYRLCREALQRELDAEPEAETEAYYQEILAGRVPGDDPPGVPARPSQPATLPLPVRRLVTGALVGREPELKFLLDELRLAEDGRGGAVLVGGESGAGKSRLVAEVARAAHSRGAAVLWGGAYEQEGQLPYGALVEALDRHLASLPPEVRTRLGTVYAELAGLIPALGGGRLLAPPFAPAALERTQLFAAVDRLIEELGARQPVVLILDDLQSADTATIQLLHHLAHRAAERHWLLLGTYRAEDIAAGSELHHLRTLANRPGAWRRLDLDRLTPEDSGHLITQALAGGEVPAALRERLYRRSLGNPLFLLELVRALREQSALTLVAGQWTAAGELPPDVPRRLSDLIEVRVERLGKEARGVLAVVAAAGEECSFQLLQSVSNLPDATLLDALDRALATQVLEERDAGYGFRHPLIRATVAQRLSTPRRRLLHAALATAIEQQPETLPASAPARVEALAHHWAEAGEAARAVPYLVRAADRAARVYANAEAIQRLERALALLAATPGAYPYGESQRGRLLERLGDLRALIGDNGAAHAAYDLALPESGRDSLSRGRLNRKIAQQALIAGDLAHAGTFLASAAASVDAATPSRAALLERARLLATQAQAHFLADRFPEALKAATESARLASAAGSAADHDQAAELEAMTRLVLGEWQRGTVYEQRHRGLSDLNQFVQDVADVHLCLAEYYAQRDPDQAVREADRFLKAQAEAERVGAPRSLALCHYFLGTDAYFRGRFDEGMSRLTTAIALYDQIGSASGAAIALMMRGVTQTALGRLSAGRQDLEQGLTTAASAPARLRSHAEIRLYAGLTQNQLDANDPAGARRFAEIGLSLAGEPSTCICYAAIHPVATVAFALTGDLERGARLGQRALQHARNLNSPAYLCLSHQALATVHTLAGDWQDAFAALDAARNMAEAHGFAYERGRILLQRAFVHTQRRHPHDLATASALAAEAHSMLRQLGVRTASVPTA